MPNELLWIWFACAMGEGCMASDKLLDKYKNPATIYELTSEEIKQLDYLSVTQRRNLLKKDLKEANEISQFCEKYKVQIIHLESELYPQRLKNILNRPILFYCKGTLPDIDNNLCVSVVGTRTFSNYGSNFGYAIAYDISKGGGIIVSGLAKGIDGVAHKGAIDALAPTVAVLGSGIDRIYPPIHRQLAKDIVRNGAVITEYKPGTPPLGRNFPKRNRIISGLSQATVVVEADMISGSLITARLALSQGRDVFSCPGKVGERNSRGTNELLRKGAKIVTSSLDILEEYEFLYPHRINIENVRSFEKLKEVGNGPRKQSNIPLIASKEKKEQDTKKNDNTALPAPQLTENSDKTERVDKTSKNEKQPLGFSPIKVKLFSTKTDSDTEETVKVTTDEYFANKEQKEMKKKSDFDLELKTKISELSGRRLKVYNLLPTDVPIYPDDLVSDELSISSILLELTFLEADGLVKCHPGQTYTKVE